MLFNLQIVTKTIVISDSDKIHDFSDRKVRMYVMYIAHYV